MQKAYDDGIVVQTKPGTVPQMKRYLDEQRGKPLCDVWTDIPPNNSQANDDTGFDTQKPIPLLKRILSLSTNEGDLVLDPFCGCGTTVDACEEMGRKWIGIDVSIRAVDVMKDRLDRKYMPRVWTEHGEPTSIEEAQRLSKNPYDFQWWAVRMVGGRPPKGEKKKGGDGGIDGEIVIRHEASGSLRKIIVSVKGGETVVPDFVKALEHTVRHEKADYGILVTMADPSSGVKDTASDCGRVPWAAADEGKRAQRIRVVTVAEILAGTFQLPGKNETPRSASSPPPPEARSGETLHLAFSPTKAKPRKPPPPKVEKPGGAAKAKPYEAKVATGSDSEPPPSPRRRR